MRGQDVMLELVRAALVRHLGEVRASKKLGLRSAALPLSTAEDVKIVAAAAALVIEGLPQARVFIGTTAQGLDVVAHPHVWVGRPEEAAARATAARGQDAQPLIYLCATDEAGASGLAFLPELTTLHVLHAVIERWRGEVPVLEACIKSSCPQRVLEHLERVSVGDLLLYAQEARDGGDLEALPLLQLVPARLDADAMLTPSAAWCDQLGRLGGVRVEARLSDAVHALRELIEVGNSGARSKTWARLVDAGALPVAIKDGGRGRALRWAADCGAAALHLTRGTLEDLRKLLGLSRALINELLKGAAIVASDEEQPDPQVEDELGADDGGEDSADEQRAILKVREGRALQDGRVGPAALTSWLAVEEQKSALVACPPGTGDISDLGRVALQAQLQSPHHLGLQVCVTEDGLNWPAWRLVAGRYGSACVRGGHRVIALGSAELDNLVSHASRGAFGAEVKAIAVLEQLSELAHEEIGAAVEEYRSSREELVRAVGRLVSLDVDEEDDSEEQALTLDPLSIGLEALRRLPRVACGRTRELVEACLGAYDNLVDVLVGVGRHAVRSAGAGDLINHVLTMDCLMAIDERSGEPRSLQLLPLHPLALAMWLHQLDQGDASATISVAFTVAGPAGRRTLGPTGSPLVFTAEQEVSPSPGALDAGVALMADALWALLELGGAAHPGAVRVELIDLDSAASAARCVNQLVRLLVQRREASSVAAGPFLRVELRLGARRARCAPDLQQVVWRLDERALEAISATQGGDLTVALSSIAPRDAAELVHARMESRSSHQHISQSRAEHPANGRARYHVDPRSGGINRVEVPMPQGVSGWRRFGEGFGLSADAEQYFVEDALRRPGEALISCVVARGGWPLPDDCDASLLAHDEVGDDTIAVLADPGVTQALAPLAVMRADQHAPGLRSLMPSPAEDFAALQRASRVATDDARSAPLKLIRGLGGAKLKERASKARAFREDLRDPEVLTLSLDGAHGVRLAKRLSAVFGDESRTDLIRLHGERNSEGRVARLNKLELVELKAGKNADRAEDEEGRAALAEQARRMAARLSACFNSSVSPEQALAREEFRALCWLGAGLRRLAHIWAPALEMLDEAVAGNISVPITVALWACPEGPGEDEAGEDVVDRLPPSSTSPVSGTERLKWRILRPAPLPPEPEVLPNEGAVAPATIRSAAESPVAALEPKPPAAEQAPAAPPPAHNVVASAPQVEPPAAPHVADGGAVLPRFVVGSTPGRGAEVLWEPFASSGRLTNAHMMIVGGSGSGKTQALKALIASLADQGVPLLILDYKDDYVQRDFRERVGASLHDALSGLPVNPLALTPDPVTGLLQPMVHVYAIAGVLERVFGLGPQQRANLINALRATYAEAEISDRPHEPEEGRREPPFERLRRHLEEISDISLLNRLQPLFDLRVFEGAEDALDDLLERVTVLRLSQLPSETDKKAVGALLLQSVYGALLRRGHTHGVALAIVIDEAHRVANLPPVELLLKEARAFGAAVLMSSQEPADFSDALIANAGSHLVLQVSESKAARSAARLVVDSKAAKQAADRIRRLQTFEAMFRNNHYPGGVEVRVTPHFERER